MKRFLLISQVVFFFYYSTGLAAESAVQKGVVMNETHHVQEFEAVLLSYLKSHPTAQGWKISTVPENGLIETNWYRAHKGEVRLKVEIRVHQNLYRVDVWHNVGSLFLKPRKTDWAQREEWEIQGRIEKELFGR